MSDQFERLADALSDEYALEREVGRGGMATVYLAEDLRHHRQVAIKVLPPELSLSLAAERFLREIEIASHLIHPNILPLYDSGVADGMLYFVMPYIEGESLAGRMVRLGRLPIDDALQLTREVASALDYAHRHGVIHRDIKPANILLVDGHAAVTDFGIARAIGNAGGFDLTQAGYPLGTPRYMSPEQALGATDIDGRSDIHSLGRVLYEMIIGEPPVRPCDPESVEVGRFTDQPRAHQRALEPLPDRTVRALSKAIAERPEDRFPTAQEFADRLAPAQRGTAVWRAATIAPSAGRLPVLVSVGAIVVAVAAGVTTRAIGWSGGATLAVILPLVAVSAIAAVRGHRRPGGTAASTDTEPAESPTDRDPIAETHATEGRDVFQSIAVLPFADLSPTRDQEYFGDGIAEELLNALAKIEGLRVPARTSSFYFKGKNEDVRRIGAQLGVETVLEGSVRRSERRVRISAQLVDAANGFRLWNETYDRVPADIFDLQEDLAREIVGALRYKLPGGETPKAAVARTVDPAVHNIYLMGRYLWNQRRGASLVEAAEQFKQAIERDAEYAAAHAGLADAYLMLASYEQLPPAEALPMAKAAAERALALDDTLAEAHATRGNVLRSELDWRGEEQAYRRAIALNPGYATAHQWYSTLLAAQGRLAEAVEEARLAAELDPLAPGVGATAALVHFMARDVPASLEQLEKTYALAPDFLSVNAWRGIVYAELGRYDEALRAAHKAAAVNRTAGANIIAMVYAYLERWDDAFAALDDVAPHHLWPVRGAVHARRGEIDSGLDCLDRAFEEEGWTFFTLHRVLLLYIKVAPWYDPLREHPRFDGLVRRLRFPTETSAPAAPRD